MPLLPPNLKAARSRAPSTRSLVRRAGVPPDAAKGKRWWDTITTLAVPFLSSLAGVFLGYLTFFHKAAIEDTERLKTIVESAVSNDEVKERTAIRVVTYLAKSNEILPTVALSILGTMARNGTGEKLRSEAFDALENLIDQDSGMWSKFDPYDQVEILCLQAALSPGQHWRQENLNRLEKYSQKPVLGAKPQREAASKLLSLSRDISLKNPQAVIDLLLSMPILLDDPDIIDQGVPLLCEAIKARSKTQSGDVADYLKDVAEKKSREDRSRLRLYLASGLALALENETNQSTNFEEAKKFVEQRPDLRDEAEQFLDVVATEDEHLGDLAKTARAYVTGHKLAHN
jgi:hypothetical protein